VASDLGSVAWRGAQFGRRRSPNGGATPVFLVSAASKGFSFAVSSLFTTVARGFISVAAKGFMVADCWQEGNDMGWGDFEGVRSKIVGTLGGWERQNEMEARGGWETAARGWGSGYTREDSMGVARG
jgi:hypothetical protein